MKLSEKFDQFFASGEDYPREPVPKEARKPWWSIGIVWIGVYICIPSIIEGLLLIGGLPFWEAVAADVIGIFIFLFFMLFQGNIGTQTGLSAYMAARDSFGYVGSHLVSIVVAVCGFGWFAIQSRAFGESLVALLGYGNVSLISLVGGLTMMLTAIIGYRGIEALSYPAVIYTFVMMIYMAIKSAIMSPMSFSEAIAQTPIAEPMSFVSAISMVVGGMAMAVVISPDVNRFAKSFRDNVKALLLLALPVCLVQPVASIFVGMYMGSTELGKALVMAGGFWGFLLVVLGAWSSNDNNLYSCSLAVAEILPKRAKRWKTALYLGIIASIFASILDLQQYMNIMYIFNAFCIPVAGIMCADFYIFTKVKYKKEMPKINVTAVIAFIIGGIIEIAFDFSILPHPYIPTPVITILCAGIIYLVGIKFHYKKLKSNKTTSDISIV
ncbi:purine-cytosine permease-like transporter [Acetomicrobium mobile DSM 13181]|uniref:Purine-cytosine permease-like transporter n=1 Tax=Acetomicrobium mobile (strain ATCC BAA-54 / DSM 13181 / JCM 12221 / NGA) TaxID=891968 RepID=I4BZ22_ACEMN|nr:cytosine permease [Acetomicrobium mobile]AFM22529.1 purine-cytosine permease-like transporter [Acetomicrobium mobile DSM 13181]